MSRSDSTGKCPDPGVFCGYTREWCEGADSCPVVLEERRNAELERWRKQALEEDSAANAMRNALKAKDDEIASLRKLIGEMADRMQNNPCEGCDYFGECEYQGCGEAAITNKLIDRGREAAE